MGKLVYIWMIIFFLSGCNNDQLTVDRVVKPAVQVDNNDAPITFYRDVEPIFKRTCAACHNEGSAIPNWQNYEVSFAKKVQLMDRVVVKKDMPIGFPMTDAEREVIRQWLQLDAPAGIKN